MTAEEVETIQYCIEELNNAMSNLQCYGGRHTLTKDRVWDVVRELDSVVRKSV